jgi:hypothetical protein
MDDLGPTTAPKGESSSVTKPKLSPWGLSSIVLLLASFGVGPTCQRIFHDLHPCLIPYILFQLFALSCGIVAGVRGNKWWLLTSALSAVLAAQGILGLLAE